MILPSFRLEEYFALGNSKRGLIWRLPTHRLGRSASCSRWQTYRSASVKKIWVWDTSRRKARRGCSRRLPAPRTASNQMRYYVSPELRSIALCLARFCWDLRIMRWCSFQITNPWKAFRAPSVKLPAWLSNRRTLGNLISMMRGSRCTPTRSSSR